VAMVCGAVIMTHDKNEIGGIYLPKKFSSLIIWGEL
jgi:hypothetical protein